jgi:hypothetical protein
VTLLAIIKTRATSVHAMWIEKRRGDAGTRGRGESSMIADTFSV